MGDLRAQSVLSRAAKKGTLPSQLRDVGSVLVLYVMVFKEGRGEAPRSGGEPPVLSMRRCWRGVPKEAPRELSIH